MGRSAVKEIYLNKTQTPPDNSRGKRRGKSSLAWHWVLGLQAETGAQDAGRPAQGTKVSDLARGAATEDNAQRAASTELRRERQLGIRFVAEKAVNGSEALENAPRKRARLGSGPWSRAETAVNSTTCRIENRRAGQAQGARPDGAG